MTNDPDTAATVAARLDEHLAARLQFAERIYRELLMALHRCGVASIDSIHDEAHRRAGLAVGEIIDDPNLPARDRWDEAERQLVERITRESLS